MSESESESGMIKLDADWAFKGRMRGGVLSSLPLNAPFFFLLLFGVVGCCPSSETVLVEEEEGLSLKENMEDNCFLSDLDRDIVGLSPPCCCSCCCLEGEEGEEDEKDFDFPEAFNSNLREGDLIGEFRLKGDEGDLEEGETGYNHDTNKRTINMGNTCFNVSSQMNCRRRQPETIAPICAILAATN